MRRWSLLMCYPLSVHTYTHTAGGGGGEQTIDKPVGSSLTETTECPTELTVKNTSSERLRFQSHLCDLNRSSNILAPVSTATQTKRPHTYVEDGFEVWKRKWKLFDGHSSNTQRCIKLGIINAVSILFLGSANAPEKTKKKKKKTKNDGVLLWGQCEASS